MGPSDDDDDVDEEDVDDDDNDDDDDSDSYDDYVGQGKLSDRSFLWFGRAETSKLHRGDHPSPPQHHHHMNHYSLHHHNQNPDHLLI